MQEAKLDKATIQIYELIQPKVKNNEKRNASEVETLSKVSLLHEIIQFYSVSTYLNKDR